MKRKRAKTLGKIISDMVNDVAMKMCDDYCKYPDMVKDEEELRKICDRCPMNRLEVW